MPSTDTEPEEPCPGGIVNGENPLRTKDGRRIVFEMPDPARVHILNEEQLVGIVYDD